MTSTNHMHRASAPGSGRLDLSLAGRRASRRTRSQRVAVVVAHVPPALLRSSSMEVLERPSAQDPAKSGHECLTRGTATTSRSSAGFVVVFYGKISGVRIGSTMRVAR